MLFTLWLGLAGSGCVPQAQASVIPYHLSFDAPARDFHGALPLGNGEIGISAWAEEEGGLVFYLGTTDAYDDNNRLLKLGRIRVKLDPNPFAHGQPFHQELRLQTGELVIRAGQPDSATTCRLWVDASHPVVRLECESARPLQIRVALENWRTGERNLASELTHSDSRRDTLQPVIQKPDVILPGLPDRIGWYHQNISSVWPATMKLQGLESLMPTLVDPLLNRVFGGLVVGDGLVSEDSLTLKSSQPRKKHQVAVWALTRHPATPEEWLKALEGIVAEGSRVPLEQARQDHQAWWNEFWNRSWVRVNGPASLGSPAASTAPLTVNKLPLRIGADRQGGSRFRGRMAAVRIWSQALPADTLAAQAARGRSEPAPSNPAMVGEWLPGDLADGQVKNRVAEGLVAKPVGQLQTVAAQPDKALEFSGSGYLEVAHDTRLNLTNGLTLEAWIAPGQIDEAGARILDKTPVGADQAFLLDTYPGNSLRLIVHAGTLRHAAKLPPGQWSHVAGTFDARTGISILYVNGREVARQKAGSPEAPPAISTFAMTRGYVLQRYLLACGGRGNLWVKFNGSIFTLPWEKDPDYRRWGGAQWFQNARVSYWPCVAAGDYDLLAPFYRQYLDNLPMARQRTRLYYGHEGAFFPETQCFWGTYANTDYGWERGNHPVGFAVNNYIRWYWTGCLELTALMLDQYDNTRDPAFLRQTLLPLASSFVEFFDRHWPRGADGKIRFEPSQSLETWHATTDPLPEIAGLRYILPRMLSLPAEFTTEAQRAAWQKTLRDLPEVPRKTENGSTFLLPAWKYANKANAENPELYAVFPYRLFGVDKPELQTGIETFNRRQHRENRCWWQCDTHAAYLGLAATAARNVLGRLCNHNPAFAFPAMWGPHNDEIPDMDHGGNGQMALQVMLMQCEGPKILLFPAWPREWDVEFKLHAPLATTVEGVWRAGQLQFLKVTPPERRRDVVILEPQATTED